MENQEKKGLSVWVLLFLVAIMTAIVLVLFTLLGMAAKDYTPPEKPEIADSVAEPAGSNAAAPNFCPFCGEGMTESFQWGQFCPFCGEQVEQ